MKKPWEFLEGHEYEAPVRVIERVLEEHDGAVGPVVASFIEGETRYVGVAADKSEHTTRWVEASVHPVDWQSLLSRRCDLRQIIVHRGSKLWVVDRKSQWSGDQDSLPIRAWCLSPGLVGDEYLPDQDSTLDPPYERFTKGSRIDRTGDGRTIRCWTLDFLDEADRDAAADRLMDFGGYEDEVDDVE